MTLPPILGPTAVGTNPGDAVIQPGGLSFEFESGSLPTIFQENAQLLIGFSLLLEASGATMSERFEIQAASLDSDASILTVFVVETATTPQEFLTAAGAGVSASIEPTFFRVETSGQQGIIPPNASVVIEFDATTTNELNQPDETASFSSTNSNEFTPNIGDLGNDPWSWVRFRVTFDLSGGGALPLNTPRPALTLLRLPFLF